jgi:ketosteroid isomerase-like protein
MSDETEIRKVHDRWWETAAAMNVEEMRKCFVTGPHLKMYNLNGFIYHGVDELAKLWDYYFRTTKWDECQDLVEPEILVDGDMAMLTCEKCAIGIVPVAEGASMETSTLEDLEGEKQRYIFRGTEVFRRDDGNGGQSWRIWHNHYSVVDDSEPKPGLDQ